MITIQNIIDWSKPHPAYPDKARQTIIYDDKVYFSIVGGTQGLYGDFEEDFEVAIMTTNEKEFVTKFFFPEGNDDVIPYMKVEDLEKLLNDTFSKGFQVQ